MTMAELDAMAKNMHLPSLMMTHTSFMLPVDQGNQRQVQSLRNNQRTDSQLSLEKEQNSSYHRAAFRSHSKNKVQNVNLRLNN